MLVQLSTTCSNELKQPNGELQVAVNHNQLRTMASETVHPIDWSHPPPSWSVTPERHVHSINQCNLSGTRTCNRSMRGNHLAYAATQGMVILESNVTPNKIRSSDSFSKVPPIVNGGDWGCIVRDLKTIIVLVLLAFNFIPQRSHHSLTPPRSRIRDSATATLTTGDAQQPSKWSHQNNRSAYFPKWKKASK